LSSANKLPGGEARHLQFLHTERDTLLASWKWEMAGEILAQAGSASAHSKVGSTWM
jgi:hypothetical protein